VGFSRGRETAAVEKLVDRALADESCSG